MQSVSLDLNGSTRNYEIFYGKIKVDFYNVILQIYFLTEKFISCYKTVHFPSVLVNYSLNPFPKPSSLCSDS